MARDGEGATKLVICEVSGAKDQDTARTVAKSVICSSLVKTAMFGADANWGRVLCAMGYAGAEIDVTKADVSFASPAGRVEVCQNGAGIPFSEERAKQVLLEEEIKIDGAPARRRGACGGFWMRPDIRLCENQRGLPHLIGR